MDMVVWTINRKSCTDCSVSRGTAVPYSRMTRCMQVSDVEVFKTAPIAFLTQKAKFARPGCPAEPKSSNFKLYSFKVLLMF